MANILSRRTNGTTLQITVDGNPSLSSGTPAPIGSSAEATDGSGVFYKFGSGDTDWSQSASTSYVASAITAASSTFKKVSADVTSTIDTETVITDLTHPILANSTYVVRGRLALGCNGVGGVKVGVKVPSGSVVSGSALGRSANTTSFVVCSMAASGTLSGALNTVNSQGGQAYIEIVVTTSSTAGNFEFIFASQTAGQTSTIIAVGSYLEYIKIL